MSLRNTLRRHEIYGVLWAAETAVTQVEKMALIKCIDKKKQSASFIQVGRVYVKIDTPSNKFNFRRRLQISRVFMHVWSGRRDAIATTNVRPGKKEPRLRRQFIRSMSEIRSSFLAAAAIQFPTFLGPILPLLFWNPTPLAYPLHFSLQHYKCNLFVV